MNEVKLSDCVSEDDYDTIIDDFVNYLEQEELGVLQSKIDENYYVLWRSKSGFLIMTGNINKARRIKRKEAQHFPQFKWVSLESINESKN